MVGGKDPSVEGCGDTGERTNFQLLTLKRSMKQLKAIAQSSVFALLVGGSPLLAAEVNQKNS